MAYLVSAAAYRPDGSDQHYTTTRWRSDDPWGAIWRCLYDCLSPYVQWPPPMNEHGVAQITLTVRFKPDKEDFDSAIFPADPLTQHRQISRKTKRNSKHGKIPTE